MKKSLGLLLAFLLILTMTASATQDEDVSLADLHPEVSPEPMLTPAPTAAPPATPTVPPGRLFKDGSLQIIVTAGGDMTIGGDVRKRGDSLFDKELKKQGGDMGFITRNVYDILSQDDMTLVNFEGTLTTAPVYKTNNQFVFSAPVNYVDFLRNGSIEAVALENNHVMDHGAAGLADTKAALEGAGIVWSDSASVGVFRVYDVTIAMLTYQQYRDRVETLLTQVPLDVAAAKARYDIVIVSYHWGEELDYWPNSNQIKLGRLTIDSGADLVVGHHSHRINPIEKYNGRIIAYSLGNFSFAGNSKPSDMSTFLLQVKFKVVGDTVTTDSFRIIPARISSKSDYNDFAITPFTEQRHIDNVVSVLKSNGKRLDYAVDYYPLDWE